MVVSRLSLENQQLREKVEILEYLLAQSDEPHATSSAPSSEQTHGRPVGVKASGTTSFPRLVLSHSVDVLPLSTTGKLLGPRLPTLAQAGSTTLMTVSGDDPSSEIALGGCVRA